MIDTGTQLTLRPERGDAIEAIGRVVDSTAASLTIRLGRHPWLRAGTRVVCTANVGHGLVRFVTVIDDVTTDPHCAVRVGRPHGVEDANRRTMPRVTTGRSIVWADVENGRLVGPQHPGMTLDVSTGGMSFETSSAPPQPGSLIAVAIDLPFGDVVAVARVTGVDDQLDSQLDSRHYIRVESVALARAQRQNLRSWIDQELAPHLVGAKH